MEQILWILAIYYSGFIVSGTLAWLSIRAFKTKESPLFPALMSWITIIAIIAMFILAKKAEKELKNVNSTKRWQKWIDKQNWIKKLKSIFSLKNWKRLTTKNLKKS